MDEIRITFGTKDDIQTIAQFQVNMAMESEGTALDLDKVLQGVTHAMQDDSKGRYVVAHDGEKPSAALCSPRSGATGMMPGTGGYRVSM